MMIPLISQITPLSGPSPTVHPQDGSAPAFVALLDLPPEEDTKQGCDSMPADPAMVAVLPVAGFDLPKPGAPDLTAQSQDQALPVQIIPVVVPNPAGLAPDHGAVAGSAFPISPSPASPFPSLPVPPPPTAAGDGQGAAPLQPDPADRTMPASQSPAERLFNAMDHPQCVSPAPPAQPRLSAVRPPTDAATLTAAPRSSALTPDPFLPASPLADPLRAPTNPAVPVPAKSGDLTASTAANPARTVAPGPPVHTARSSESAVLLRASTLLPIDLQSQGSTIAAVSAAIQPDSHACTPKAPAAAPLPASDSTRPPTDRSTDPFFPETTLLAAPANDLPRAYPTPSPTMPQTAAAPALHPETLPTLVQSVSQTGTGMVELVLTPEDLGKLRFELTQTGDQIRIHLTVERPETLDLLRRNADQLLAEFRQAGYAGATLSFGQSGQGGQHHTPAHPAPAQIQPRQAQPDPPPAAASLQTAGSGLDLRL